MPAYLIRHAHAGHRSDWDGRDDERPLSPKGQSESDHIADLLVDAPIGEILSSPARRCVQTVDPLAQRLGLPVREDVRLAEGNDATAILDLMVELASRNPALCSHGDLIPEMIRMLNRRGMEIVEDGPSKKGSFWVVEFDGETFTKATYHPPGR